MSVSPLAVRMGQHHTSYTTAMENFSVCRYGNVSETPEHCLTTSTEHISVWVASIVLMANIIHMLFVMQLNQPKGTVFYTTLRLTTVNDILSSFSNILNSLCVFRQQVVLLLPPICLTWTVSCYSLFSFKYFVILFTIIERWLMLAKPFQYSSNIFISKYNIWVCCAAVTSIVVNFLIYLMAFIFDTTLCYDAGFGVMGSPSRLNFVIVLPYLVLHICIAFFAVMIFWQYFKLHHRPAALPERGTQLKQTSMYVVISTAAYMGCSLVTLAVQLMDLAGNGQELKPWLLIIMDTHGLWNILALYVLQSYRNNVKRSLNNFARCLNNKGVAPG